MVCGVSVLMVIASLISLLAFGLYCVVCLWVDCVGVYVCLFGVLGFWLLVV